MGDFEKYKEERRQKNKALKAYLKGHQPEYQFDPKLGILVFADGTTYHPLKKGWRKMIGKNLSPSKKAD